MSNEIEIKGLKQVVGELRKFHPELLGELKVVHLAQAEAVADTARPEAPRRSGRLAGSLRAGATATSGNVKAGSKKIPYAAPIHFGYPKRNIEPQPFLYEALDERRDEITDAYLDAVSTLTDRTF